MDFPTYVIARSQIDETLSGRAFNFCYNKNLFLKTYSVKDWYVDKESDYRVFLYQLISHDFDLFYGDYDLLKKDTEKALLQIFLYAYQLFGYCSEKILDEDRLLKSLFFSAGLNYELPGRLKKMLLKNLTDRDLIKLCEQHVAERQREETG